MKKRGNKKVETIIRILGINISVGNLIIILMTFITICLTFHIITKDRGKLKFEFMQFVESVKGDKLSKETFFEFKITNIGNRRVFLDYLVATSKGKELYKWKTQREIKEGVFNGLNLTLNHPCLWVLKEVENIFIIDTKGEKWYLKKKDTFKIRNHVRQLYKKWNLPESHNVNEKEYFNLKEEKSDMYNK